jgi:hypothetical protein
MVDAALEPAMRRCVNWADVVISGAIGAIAPTFLSQVLRGKPGPLGFTRAVETFNWAARAVPAGYAVKRVMPDFKIASDDCECQACRLVVCSARSFTRSRDL